MRRYSTLIAALLASHMVETPNVVPQAAKELDLEVPKQPRLPTKTGTREKARRLRQLARQQKRNEI